MKPLCSSAFICVLMFFASAARAGVTVTDAWVRGMVPAQQSTAAYMTITSDEGAKIVAITTPAARKAELHATMAMNGIMHMHAMDAFELPAHKAVELKAGGMHVMLTGVTKPLQAGRKVPFVFTVVDAAGKRSTFEATADVRPIGR